MQEADRFDVMARTAAMSRAEQDEAVGAGFTALSEAVEADNENGIEFTFDALSAVLDGVAESRLQEIVDACQGAAIPEIDVESYASQLAKAVVEVDQRLGRQMLEDTMAEVSRPAGVRSDREDYLYRVWAVTAASSEEILRIIREEPGVEDLPELSLLVFETYTQMASELAPGAPLPKFRMGNA